MSEASKRKGFGILETVLASALIAGSLYALASVLLLAGSAIEIARERLAASFLVEEGMEVLRHRRDAGWDANIANLTPGQDYYVSFDAGMGSWSISASPEPVIEGLFLRRFRVERVSRDMGANIELPYNPANEDSETRKIIVAVTWTHKNSPHAMTLEGYLMDIFND
ncbi:MAG: hypothetical protein AAB846_00075 [Patescibacteria group bacterium]